MCDVFHSTSVDHMTDTMEQQIVRGISQSELDQFNRDGYTIARGLFDAEEIERFREHYMQLNAEGTHDGDYAGVEGGGEFDPLKQYPRMIHMHRWDDVSRDFLLDPRVFDALNALLGGDPYAVQTMLYFKPPGARGQAVHQDNFYLRAEPSTCCAAWLALDVCDADNGALMVVPGSQTWPLLCTVKADTSASFTDVTVPLPEGVSPVTMTMQPGDMLFFNGQVVHGSTPNSSEDRFRRSLIGHYIQGDAEKVSRFYSPMLRRDGSEYSIGVSEGGGSCGVWVDRDGVPVIEDQGLEGNKLEHE
jgi:phytanoyl-CoA hydroxylase